MEFDVPGRLMVSPRYDPDVPTGHRVISSVEGITPLVQRSVNLQGLEPPAFASICEIVQGAECYQSTIRDIHEAVDRVTGLAEE